MKRWILEFSLQAERDIVKFDREMRRRIIDKLEWFLNNFDSIIPLPLSGEYKEFYKLRIGGCRVIYKIERQPYKIIICYIDWRDKVYKKR